MGSKMTNGKKYLSYVTKIILLSLHGKVWYWGGLEGWLLLEAARSFPSVWWDQWFPVPRWTCHWARLFPSDTSFVKQIPTMEGLMLGQVDPQGRLPPCGMPGLEQLLTGPMDPRKTEPTLEHILLAGLVTHSWETAPLEGIHTGAVQEELQPVGRTHDGEVNGQLSHRGGTLAGMWGVLSLQMKVQHRQHEMNWHQLPFPVSLCYWQGWGREFRRKVKPRKKGVGEGRCF